MKTIKFHGTDIVLADNSVFVCMLDETHYIVYRTVTRIYFIETNYNRYFLFDE